MTPSLQHDYISLAEVCSSLESSCDKSADGDGANLRETELRLGLPGSESPIRKDKPELTLCFLPSRNIATNAKKVFFDAFDGNSKWGFCGRGVSEVEMENGGNDVSVRAGQVQEKKTQWPPSAKSHVVGWPPIRCYRKKNMATNPSRNNKNAVSPCLFVKVSLDGAPYLRKVDLKTYCSYKDLSSALEKMFSGFTFGLCVSKGIPNKDWLCEGLLSDLFDDSEYVLTYEDKDGDWMLVGDVPWELFIESCKRLRIIKGLDAIGLAPRTLEKSKNWN